MSKFHLETLVKDPIVRRSLSSSLADDGRLSYDEVRLLLKSTLDGDGVSPRQFEDVKIVLKDAKTLDSRSQQLIKSFLEKHYRPIVSQKATPTGQLTPNFNAAEFACKDGTAVPSTLIANVKLLAENLQKLRDDVGKPIKINSGYRTPTHNKAIGGAAGSQHVVAKAADIVVSGIAPKQVAKRIEALIDSGVMKQGGLKSYNTFVHYDVRGTKARW